jgi:hypothetical protein
VERIPVVQVCFKVASDSRLLAVVNDSNEAITSEQGGAHKAPRNFSDRFSSE